MKDFILYKNFIDSDKHTSIKGEKKLEIIKKEISDFQEYYIEFIDNALKRMGGI